MKRLGDLSSLLSTSPNYSPAFCFFPLSSPTFHPSTIHHPQLAVNHKSLRDVTREQVTWLYEVVTGGKDKPFVSNEPGSEGDVLASYLSGHGITLIPWEIETSSVDSPSQIGATPRTAGGGLLESVLVKRSGSSTSGLSPGEVSRAGIQV
ncbi:hypothetical protein V6Z94_005494 [Aspergillus fumigatus]